jgi:hypothetical protein
MALADSVSMHLANANFDHVLRVNIISICNSLKMFGQQLETVYKGMVNILSKLGGM